jgi:transposase
MDFGPQVRKRMVELSVVQKMEVWEIARLFAASESGVRRVLQRNRERGTHLPLPRNPGRKLQMTDTIAGQIRDFVAGRPDATRQQIKDALGLSVSLQAISEWLARLGLRLKKSR